MRRRCARRLAPGGGPPRAPLPHLSLLQRCNLRWGGRPAPRPWGPPAGWARPRAQGLLGSVGTRGRGRTAGGRREPRALLGRKSASPAPLPAGPPLQSGDFRRRRVTVGGCAQAAMLGSQRLGVSRVPRFLTEGRSEPPTPRLPPTPTLRTGATRSNKGPAAPSREVGSGLVSGSVGLRSRQALGTAWSHVRGRMLPQRPEDLQWAPALAIS